jgi:hypothetical protein
MGQNKAQREAAARAKKTTAHEVQPAVGPNPGQINADSGKVNVAHAPEPDVKATPAPAPTVAAPQASKQQATLDKLKAAWTEEKVDLSKMSVTMDGKFMLIVVAEGWPIVQLGPTGGIVLPQIRSYAKAWDAAMDGKAVFEKQQARDQKKATATAPAPKAAASEAVTA